MRNRNDFQNFHGVWKCPSPWDSEDYLVCYEISGTSSSPRIDAWDDQDGEEILISNITWDDARLYFDSFLESTNRKGKNFFSFDPDTGRLNTEFTFTVFEQLIKSKDLKLV